jgi:5'(3')-deoxyribonucleotidase
MTLIMCDVDSTLYDADVLFSELANDAGIDWPDRISEWKPAHEIYHYNGKHCSVDDLKKIFRKAHSEEYVSKQIPYPHAQEVISAIAKEEDVRIAYISDRNTQQTSALKDWLNKWDFLVPHSVVMTTKDKRDWLRTERPNIVIDDRVRTLLMARYEIGAQCLTIRHNHNVNLRGEAEGIFVCRDWLEIGDKLLELI